jgi:tyrosinase
MTRIRRNVLALANWDPILHWYALAVREMKKRKTVDPLSWWFQGAVHEFDAATQALGLPGGPLPSAAVRNKFWQKCQHATWFFLPWHRAYLLFFEKMVIKTIRDLHGPADTWALPYWNYADTTKPNANHLPFAFRQPKMLDGSDNALFITQRAPACNSNLPVGTSADTNDTGALGKPAFENNGPILQFGGGSTGFAHFGNVTGACEFTPHNSMHRAIGGATGWMTDPGTAALDPIFWLHHANIDRMWEAWRRSPGSRTNPAVAAWLTKVSFDFHDETGAPVTVTASQMVDILAPLLNYDYEGLPPRPPAPHDLVITSEAEMGKPKPIPEMVGASSGEPLVLGSEESHADFPISAPTGPAAAAGVLAAAENAAPPTIHLVLENVKAHARPVESYEVYVNVPQGSRPQDHPELMAGVLAPFGVVEASDPNNPHGGDGMNYSMDITQIVNRLKAANAWDPNNLRVSFIPHRFAGDREENVEMKPLQVGRVSLYFS